MKKNINKSLNFLIIGIAVFITLVSMSLSNIFAQEEIISELETVKEIKVNDEAKFELVETQNEIISLFKVKDLSIITKNMELENLKKVNKLQKGNIRILNIIGKINSEKDLDENRKELKVKAFSKEERVEGIDFEIYRKSDDELITRLTSDGNGIIDINLRDGEYYLKQVKGPIDIIVDTNPIEFKVNRREDAKAYIIKNRVKTTSISAQQVIRPSKNKHSLNISLLKNGVEYKKEILKTEQMQLHWDDLPLYDRIYDEEGNLEIIKNNYTTEEFISKLY